MTPTYLAQRKGIDKCRLKAVPVLNQAQCHEDVCESGDVTPHILNLSASGQFHAPAPLSQKEQPAVLTEEEGRWVREPLCMGWQREESLSGRPARGKSLY